MKRLSRLTGVLYLVLAVLGMFSPLVATADNLLSSRPLFATSLVVWLGIVLLDAALAVLLYVLLRPVDRTLSLFAAAVRLVYTAMLATILLDLFHAYRVVGGDEETALAALATFDTGLVLALVFFGVHVVLLGLLLYRSGYVPRLLGVLVTAAGAGYVVDSLATFFVAGYGGGVLIAVVLVGELSLVGWLLVRGLVPRAV